MSHPELTEEKNVVSFLEKSVSQVFENLGRKSDLLLWEKHGSVTEKNGRFIVNLPLSIDLSPSTILGHLRYIKGINIDCVEVR